MSIADDRLEILIGKLLDGELSPAEQRVLESELEHNSAARELLAQLRTLQRCSREVMTREVLEGGTDPKTVFSRAWQQRRGSFRRRIIRADGRLPWGRRILRIAFGGPHFAVGLAAGFLLGFGLHVALVRDVRPPAGAAPQSPIAADIPGQIDEWEDLLPARSTEVIRKVDWYGFTDATGNQWLIEGVQEGVARPAAYYGDLY